MTPMWIEPTPLVDDCESCRQRRRLWRVRFSELPEDAFEVCEACL